MLVNGPTTLSGSVRVSGSKNESLAMIPLSLCTDGEFIMTNVPRLTDVDRIVSVIGACGKKVDRNDGGLRITGPAEAEVSLVESADFAAIRASLFCVGPLIARGGIVSISSPGGCPIGQRPIDMHMRALRELGVVVTQVGETIVFDASSGLTGADIRLEFPSVGTTLNLLSAATGCRGVTTLRNIALEPEIQSVVSLLSSVGIDIAFIGDREIRINPGGKQWPSRATANISSDRIEAGTLLASVMACGGEVEIRGFPIDIMDSPLKIATAAGVQKDFIDDTLQVESPRRVNAVDITADVYPGFPTDLQPVFSAALCYAKGQSRVHDRVFKERFQFTSGLKKMGAEIRRIQGGIAITGRDALRGANVEGMDIRGIAALVIAAISASGETRIGNAHILNRGYEMLDRKLVQLGCDISKE